MERSFRGRRNGLLPHRIRSSPYPLRSYRLKVADEVVSKQTLSTLAMEKKDYEDATCSVCMEFPHNAVLLLCSSHDRGCRPYMCGTGHRHSNCLGRFKKAYAKIHDESAPPTVIIGEDPKPEPVGLAACPLCRGQVKGWTVVEAAREFLNKKRRSCVQDDCTFTGTYKELQMHVKSEHPCAKPREVDPMLEQEWRRLEHEREREDVMSTIRSSMPRSVVFGDYVIEMANGDLDDSEEDEADMGGDGGGGLGISRSILYFFLREGARLMRLGRDADEDVNGDPIDGLPPIAGGYTSRGNEDEFEADPADRGRGVAAMEAERRRRRRRLTLA